MNEPVPSADQPWHTMSADELARLWQTDLHRGLSLAEAATRLRRFGPNQLPRATQESSLQRLLRQLKNPLLAILLVAAVVSALLGEVIDAAVILAVVVGSVLLGWYQEGKAVQALQAVAALLTPKAIVIRDGERHEIDAAEVVPGDLIWVEAGLTVPADARLVSAVRLATDESLLTGESLPVDKGVAPIADPELPLADRSNMIWSATLVVRGQGTAIVCATGAKSQIGRIGALVERSKPVTTPLIRRLEQFSWQVSWAILAAAVLLFLLAYWGPAQVSLAHAFTAVVGIAVAAIPEGLPAIVLIILAVGAERLARAKALVRQLPAVETLGSVTVIGSDKTGTLTKNEMTATLAITAVGAWRSSGVGYAPEGSWFAADSRSGSADEPLPQPLGAEVGEGLTPLLVAGLLCNDSALKAEPDGTFLPVGDPLEVALITAALKAGQEPEYWRTHWRRIDSLPFDPEKRYMATLHSNEAGRHLLIVKGAFEAVVPRVKGTAVALRWHGSEFAVDVAPFAEDQWHAQVEAAAAEGLRVIAFAVRELPEAVTTIDETLLEELQWLGLVGLVDPPRPEAIAAVAECRQAGVRVVMITGDHPTTASAIARQLQLPQWEQPLTGRELATLDDAALHARLATTDVVARAIPEQKQRLVRLWQEQGEIVAMTGDGANDAPALAAAHIGIAMGQRGTDAARAASSLVLADDNFATIARAVSWGRVAYDNVKKCILFMLPTNLAQALVVAVPLVFGGTLPITATQILWVNLITTVILATALAFEGPERNVMRRPPRPPQEPLITRWISWRILFIGILFAALTYSAFLVAEPHLGVEGARTAAVNMLVLLQVVYLFSCRTFTDSSWRRDLWVAHPSFYFSLAGILLVQGLFTYAPAAQWLFHTAPLPGHWWLAMGAVAAAGFVLVEMEKRALKRLGREVL